MAKKTFYDVLQVSPGADPEIIKAAYRSLVQRYHPDKNAGNPDAEQYLKIINRAYEVLSDPVKRGGYDAALVEDVENQTSQADVATSTEETTPSPEANPAKNNAPLRIPDWYDLNHPAAKANPAKKAMPTDDSAQVPDSGVMGLYKAIIGEKNTNYYLTKFEQFDHQGPGLKASWNWPAFVFGGMWALYRKMYGWFFALWGVAFVETFLAKAGAFGYMYMIYLTAHVAIGIYANSIYHGHVRKKIAAAQSTIHDEPKLLAYLRDRGGVSTIVLLFGLVPIVGILAAIAIPAYNDSQQRATALQSQESTIFDRSTARPIEDSASTKGQQPATGGYGANDTLVEDGTSPQSPQPATTSEKDPLGLYGAAAPQGQQPTSGGYGVNDTPVDGASPQIQQSVTTDTKARFSDTNRQSCLELLPAEEQWKCFQ